MRWHHPLLPNVSRDAWEQRFGKPPTTASEPQLPVDKSGRPDVSHDAWHARYGYKAGEIDRRFPDEKDVD